MSETPTPIRSPIGDELRASLVGERDGAFTASFARKLEAEKRRAVLFSLLWRMAIIGSVALLIAASTVGGFYLARLGAKTITGF